MWSPWHAWAGVMPLGVLIKAKEDQLTRVQPVNQAELMVAGVSLELIWGSPRKMGPIRKLLGTIGVILRGTSLPSAPPASLGSPGYPHCGSVLFWACGQHALPSCNAQSRIKPAAQDLQLLPTCAGTRLQKEQSEKSQPQLFGFRNKPRNISVKRRFHI